MTEHDNVQDTVIQRRSLPPDFCGLEGLHPILARVYGGRKITDAAQIEYGLKHLLPYQDLKGINDALDLLINALKQQQRLLIIGDFDADGATSTALAVQALSLFGFESVDYLVPNRFEYGYGLTVEIVEQACKLKPDLIITVDNGISSVQGVAAANAAGIKVLITDHHLAGEMLPQAAAIVNPNQPGCKFASKALPGVGVIFYVMLALRARLRESGWFEQTGQAQPNLGVLLDLVALGTVADVVPLDYNNRILIAQGLARVCAGETRPGIQALLQVAKRNPAQTVAGDFGFCVAPRINAAGRLEDMSLGIECLLSEDAAQAETLAQRLDQLNRERRNIEDKMKQQALVLLASMQLDDDLPLGLCLYEPDWHEGVVGIVASRLKDRLHRPVIAFALSANGQIKGSARSVSGVHIRDILDAVAAQHPQLISRFGGHAMAAGLSLPEANFAEFAQAFDVQVRQQLSQAQLRGVLVSDGELTAPDFTLPVAELLRKGGPWGQSFDEPLFDGEFELVQRRIVAERHLKMVLRVPQSERLLDAIAFNITDADWPPQVERVEAVYRLDVNEFRGERSLQLMVQHLRPL